jgi:hypothetical protein
MGLVSPGFVAVPKQVSPSSSYILAAVAVAIVVAAIYVMRRYRLRFSLRMFFVLVTVLCIWLGREVSIVRERKLLRQEWSERWWFYTVAMENRMNEGYISADSPRPVSWLRRALGDEAVKTVTVNHASVDEQARLKRAFPEARLGQVIAEIDGVTARSETGP